jgi:hypothetical protein
VLRAESDAVISSISMRLTQSRRISEIFPDSSGPVHRHVGYPHLIDVTLPLLERKQCDIDSVGAREHGHDRCHFGPAIT